MWLDAWRALRARGGLLDDLLALGAGAILPLAFAPFGLFPIAFVAPGALLHAWREASPWRAAWRGWLFGLGAFGFGVSWIHESFRFSNVPALVALVLTVGFVAFLALYPAALGWVHRRAFPVASRAAALVAFPAGWVLVEWLRGWLLTGFTWLQLGYSQIDSPLAGLLPVAGVYGVGWIVATGGAFLAVAVERRGRAIGAAAAFLVVAHAAGWLIGRVAWTAPVGAPMSVVLVQGDVPQDKKWLPSMLEPTLKRYLELTSEHWGANLVVWPETALPGEMHRLSRYIDHVGAEAASHGTAVLLGAPFYADGRFYNTVALVGTSTGLYHKRHLVPFGEYLPLPWLLDPIVHALGIRVADFSPGPAHQPLLEVDHHPFGVSICYEIAFGEEVIRDLPAAEFLVTVSNDAWFGNSIGPHQHMQIARARARETGRWLVRATNTGISAVVGPDGRFRARAPQFRIAVLTAEIQPRTGATPYVRTGDAPVVVLLAAALAGAFALGRRRPRA